MIERIGESLTNPVILPDGIALPARRYCSVSRLRRVAAIALQLALLVLPFSGGNAHERHCADADHAPAATMDMPCHSLPACSTPVMLAVATTEFVPIAFAAVVADGAAGTPLSVTQTPEPPPPRA